MAIALLDAADGEIDLEDDDPSGDPLDEHGEHPTDTAQVLLPTRPRYGVDQSKGPINEREAHRAWQLSMLREEFR